MSLISKTPLPPASQLWPLVKQGDFIDGYAVTSALAPRAAADIGLGMPKWADALLALRNRIVAPLGLKTQMDRGSADAIFPITYESPDEVIMGTDDSHLDFRIAIMRQGARIHMATWVHRNNLLGRVYLGVVLPFHILIVRDAMRRIAKAPQMEAPRP